MKTVRTKILSGFIVVLVIGIALGITGITSIRIINGLSNEQETLHVTNSAVTNVLNAHYIWRQTLTEAVLNGTNFEGALDPNTCALGKWINSGETANITDVEILNLMSQLTEPQGV